MDAEEDSSQETNSESCEIPGYSSVNAFAQRGFGSIVQATRSSNELPVGDDYHFYSTFPSAREVMDIEGRRILTLLQKVIRYHNVKGNMGPGASKDLEERFDVLMDANDLILERAGTLLDEASGIKKQETKLLVASAPAVKPSASWNRTPSSMNSEKAASAYKLLTSRNILRPQVRFKSKIDNSAHPFKPCIREKPNALKSLEESLALPAAVTIDDSERPDFIHPHPYAFEIEAFCPSLDSLLKRSTPQEPQSLDQTPLIMIDSKDQLENLMYDLREVTEIAIDLEHHSYRSFQGLTCLMQISTRSKDYIIDTLELREDLIVLNEIFTDPKVTKVLHGADSDVLWLQRDFGLYLVNLFDTGQAARVLGLQRFSLAHLWMVYLKKEADKQFQLADWRIRPLPQELINYAREDTHYLLYIYDLMRNQLVDSGNEQGNLCQSVCNRSKTVALQIYHKPIFKEDDYVELYTKSKKIFNSRQLAALKALCQWRNHMAREEDESYGYVLPNHMLLQIAEILPRERQGVLACCNPIPPLVRQNLPEIHNLILQAREIILSRIEKQPVSKPSVAEHPKYDPDSLLNCPHDMTHHDESIAHIEKSISETGLITGSFPSYGLHFDEKPTLELKTVPMVSAFSNHTKKMTRTAAKKLADQVKSLFSNPFIKYLPQELNVSRKKQVVRKWRLKPPTNPKKLESKQTKPDLDSFEPEFVPPAKKARMNINLLPPLAGSSRLLGNNNMNNNNNSNNNAINQASTSSGSQGLFRVPAPVGPIGKQEKNGKEKIKDKIKAPKTLKQESLHIKKAKKKKEKRQRMKEEAKKQAEVSSSPTLSESTPSTSTEKGSNQKRIKEGSSKAVPTSSTTFEPISIAKGEAVKKKKKKKLSINDIGKNFASFNYEAVENQLKKEWKEKKKMDVFNPNLPSRKKDGGKKGAKATTLSGKKKKKV